MTCRSGMSMSGGHTPWWRSHGAWKKGITVLVAATVAHGLSGCFIVDGGGCSPYTHRCVGNARQFCEPPCSDVGCEAQWVAGDTCQICMELDDDAICVLSTTPEPRCKGGQGTFCDGNLLTDCTDGFVSSREDCARADGPDAGNRARGTCVESGSSTHCAPPQTCCDDSAAAPACGAPSACGEVAATFSLSGPLPVATGGVIADGVYVLDRVSTFGSVQPALPPQAHMTWTVQSGVLTTSDCWNGAPSFASGPFTIDANRLVFQPACSTSPPDGELPFSVSGPELLVYVSRDGGSNELLFLRS